MSNDPKAMSAQELIAYIQEQVRKACKSFIGVEATKDARKQVTKILEKTLKSMAEEIDNNSSKNINFETIQKDNNEIEIIPKNLFTFLCMKGFRVSPQQIIADRYTDPCGITFVFKDGKVFLEQSIQSFSLKKI